MQGLRVEVAQAALEEPRSALKAPLAELKSGVRASVLMDGARVRFFLEHIPSGALSRFLQKWCDVSTVEMWPVAETNLSMTARAYRQKRDISTYKSISLYSGVTSLQSGVTPNGYREHHVSRFED